MTRSEQKLVSVLTVALEWSTDEILFLKGSIPFNPYPKPKFDLISLLEEYIAEEAANLDGSDDPDYPSGLDWKGVFGA